MRTVVVGDQYIPAHAYIEALRQIAPPSFGPVTEVTWAGTKSQQHALQQRMEWQGANAVPAPPEVADGIADAELLAVHFCPVGTDLLRAAPKLRAIAVARAGVENVDLHAASAHGVAVFNVEGRNASGVAELAIGLMLNEARNIARADASIKQGGWRKDFPGARIELAGRTVGLVGFGHVGRLIARRLTGFDCRILVADPYVPQEKLAAHGAVSASLEELFAAADFISVQAKLTPETERFIGAELFALMKPTAYFVNVGRSRLVDYAALYDVLASGRIAGAGLDVHDDEPLPSNSRWRSLDNVTMTTHFGGDTMETTLRSARLAAEVLVAFARNGAKAHAVNARELGVAS
jgi:D-3-phosphoglycerate dehydrogenase